LPESDPLDDVAAAIRQHPKFDIAALHYTRNMLNLRREMGVFNRVGTDHGLHICGYVIFLYYMNASKRPEDGATFTRLLDICQKRGHCGSRALRSVLLALQLFGYARTTSGQDDRRARAFEPTEKLLAMTRKQFGQTMECMDLLTGSSNYGDLARTDPDFLANFMATSGRAFLDYDISITDHVPELYAMLRLNGGYPTIISIVDAQGRGQESPSPQAIAMEYKVSSSQARNVIKQATDAGFLTISANGRVIEAVKLADNYKMLICRELALSAKYSLGLEGYFKGFQTAKVA